MTIRHRDHLRTETHPTEAFDVMCPPTTYRPVQQLGYLVFSLCLSGWVPGGYSYTCGFQSRAKRVWRGRS